MWALPFFARYLPGAITLAIHEHELDEDDKRRAIAAGTYWQTDDRSADYTAGHYENPAVGFGGGE